MENDEATTADAGQERLEVRDRRFPRSYFMPKPVKMGEEMDVSITEVSRRGDGMTRVKGYVVFVPNTKAGDNVKIKITQIRPNHAIGEVI
ncbi:MAG: TRAM domain-containing protein [Nitrososphaerales archaeon]